MNSRASRDNPDLPRGAGETNSSGYLLNGRVRYAQPRHGFRSGIEPVLLAAAVPARPGERVLEGGSGAGALLLCLAARVPGVRGLGLERDLALAALAARNADANGMTELAFSVTDLPALPDGPGIFDHACANPPYHSAAGTASPLISRESAKRGYPGLLGAWAGALASPLRHGGTLTFILPVAALVEALAAMAGAGCPANALLPLWPKHERPAKLMLLQGAKGGRAPLRLLPGLVLHTDAGAFTPEADAILRDGAALTF